MNQFELDIKNRLRAIKVEFDFKNNEEMGKMCAGASSNQVSNWLNGYNLPRVPEMNRLCEQKGITLDWLYRGCTGSMDPKLAKRLAKRIANGPG